MAQRPDIVQIKEAYELAIEAAKQRTPAQLRELVIHQLTQHALDAEVPPAQRIQALKLLGTVSEVAAFTERKEVTQVKRSEDVRAALIERLRAITGSAVEGEIVDAHGADSLLEEIREGTAQNDDENAQTAADGDPVPLDPTHAPPPDGTVDHLGTSLHSIPLSHSPLESTPPVFQKKAPADTPTPSDMETPHVKGTGD